MEAEGSARFAPDGVTVLHPDSPGFRGATARWNAYKGPGFTRAATPTNAQAVAEIVKAARAANIPFLATGGRHGYGTTFSKLQNGMAIDLRGLNNISVDTANKTVTVGGGASMGGVINAVADAGYQIPAGTCNTAGYVGVSIGAGIGFVQGTLGLMVDMLVSAKLVTATGELIEVSESSNADLFWAIRGAGANFGIITSATYKISDSVNGGGVFFAEAIYTMSQQADLFRAAEALQDEMPPELGFSVVIFWNPMSNSTGIAVTFVYRGAEEKAQELIKPFLDIGPMVVAAETIPFTQLPGKIMMGNIEAACQTTDGVHSVHAANLRRWSAATFSSVCEQFDNYLTKNEEARESNNAIIMELFSPAAAMAVPDESTAYPWRDSMGFIMIQVRWPGLGHPFEDVANNLGRKLRDELAAASGYPGLSVYVNYAWGDETLEQIYGKDKLQRLVVLKKKWDPDNVFAYANGIPTEYP